MPLHYEITITLHYLICRAPCLLCFWYLFHRLPHSLPLARNRLADDAAGGNFLNPCHGQLVDGTLVAAHLLEAALLTLG